MHPVKKKEYIIMLDIVTLITIFVLAIFVGFEVITKVPPTLHTPLMSGSNAISGITIIGAILSAGSDHTTMTTINVVGGFMVTHRMLKMFQKGKKR